MSKKLTGKITISRPVFADGREAVCIAVHDCNSHVEFLEIEMGLGEFAKAITGFGNQKIEMEIRHLDKVGLVRQSKEIEFQLDTKTYGKDRQNAAVEKAKVATPAGWIPPTYFGSQGSFFHKGEKQWARGTAYRFVEPEESEHE